MTAGNCGYGMLKAVSMAFEKKISKKINQMKEDVYILIALFKTTVEQQVMLKGNFTGKSKQRFNLWQNQGNMFLDELEGKNQLNDDQIEAISDVLHDTMSEIKRQITPKENDKK